MTNCENPINTLSGYSKNFHNFNITLIGGTSNRDEIFILLSDFIKKWSQFSHIEVISQQFGATH